jgi:DNA-binding beta-propeller fold protein YncE
MRAAALFVWCCLLADAQHYRAPAGTQPAARRPGAASILPGGRIITPLGRQFITGPGSFGIARSPRGRNIVTADGGPRRYALTVLDRSGTPWQLRHHVADWEGYEGSDPDWRSVFLGLAFENENNVWASEGESGRVRLVDVRSGSRRRLIDLNEGEFADSYTGDLALDRDRNLLYVLDQANFRLVIVDARRRNVVASVRVGRLPFAIALSPDRRRVYVTNIGMFEYRPIPGAHPARARETGLPFPAFGFPSPEAAAGVKRKTAEGTVEVPGLGDPNVEQSNSLCVVDVQNPAAPKIVKFIRTGKPFGGGIHGGSSPSGVVATAERIFVTNGHNDSITVIGADTLEVEKEVLIRIPGLEPYRGVLPVGMLVQADAQRLFVAEAGINAVGVVDLKRLEVVAHIPAAWFPTRLVEDEGLLFVSSAKGLGTGPNARSTGPIRGSFMGEIRRGAISAFPIPDDSELPKLTGQVLFNNGFLPREEAAPDLPAEIRHVVLIVKENRTFDEVFGGIEEAANGPVRGLPLLARFGRRGIVVPPTDQLATRLIRRNVNVTPNHHALAERFAFSDNFYADSEVSVDGHHWIVGSYPNAWTETSMMAAYGGQKRFRLPTSAPGRLQFAGSNSSVHPEEQLEAGAVWHHLERHDVTFRNYGEGFELAGINEGEGLKPTGARMLTNVPMPDPLYRNTSRTYPGYNMNIPDQYRADQFIREVEELYVKPDKDLPRFIFMHLPNDHMAQPRIDDGYPFAASFVADNDYALGRIVEYLSRTKWWKNMAIFITEDDAQGGVDHIDSHRTVLLAVSPYAKKNYVSRVNSSFPGLLKTAFRLLGMPPLNLYDAAATDLADCFTTAEPDFSPYRALPADEEIFVPEKAKEPLDPEPSPPLDDPSFLQRQHQRQQ